MVNYIVQGTLIQTVTGCLTLMLQLYYGLFLALAHHAHLVNTQCTAERTFELVSLTR